MKRLLFSLLLIFTLFPIFSIAGPSSDSYVGNYVNDDPKKINTPLGTTPFVTTWKTDYRYQFTNAVNGKVITGHFSLKR